MLKEGAKHWWSCAKPVNQSEAFLRAKLTRNWKFLPFLMRFMWLNSCLGAIQSITRCVNTEAHSHRVKANTKMSKIKEKLKEIKERISNIKENVRSWVRIAQSVERLPDLTQRHDSSQFWVPQMPHRYVEEMAWLPCWPPRCQQVLHQRWISV